MGKEIERLSSENVSIQVHINAMAGTNNESSMQDLMAKVKSNNDKIDRCNARISTLKQNIEKMDKRLGDIKSLMGELKSDIDGLYKDMENLKEAVYNADDSYAEYFRKVQEQQMDIVKEWLILETRLIHLLVSTKVVLELIEL